MSLVGNNEMNRFELAHKVLGCPCVFPSSGSVCPLVAEEKNYSDTK